MDHRPGFLAQECVELQTNTFWACSVQTFARMNIQLRVSFHLLFNKQENMLFAKLICRNEIQVVVVLGFFLREILKKLHWEGTRCSKITNSSVVLLQIPS